MCIIFVEFAVCADIYSHGMSVGHVMDCDMCRAFTAYNFFHYVSNATCCVKKSSKIVIAISLTICFYDVT